jgi:hypothetical protein
LLFDINLAYGGDNFLLLGIVANILRELRSSSPPGQEITQEANDSFCKKSHHIPSYAGSQTSMV